MSATPPNSHPQLRRAELLADPIDQFRSWFQEAGQAGIKDHNAMTLATATRDGVPSARVVLLKDFDEQGFTFFTNYESQKGRELSANPHAALVFHWAPFDRQVRITGAVSLASREASEDYFKTRPLGSRLGAWASTQSQILENRADLEARVQRVRERFGTAEIPLPPFWGGFVLKPSAIEFWQGRPDRLHDRFRYTRPPNGPWRIGRLSP